MKIILEMNNCRYTYESPYEDADSGTLKEMFSRLLVLAGFSPAVIDLEDEGSYQYVGEDEEVRKAKKDETDEGAERSIN